jgi:DNA sulfur modification protein DndC
MSNLTKSRLAEIKDTIRTEYLSGNVPWIIGFSGGKDSTCVLQLVWNALVELSNEKLRKPIYIISSDTLVEIPEVINQLDSTLKLIHEYSKKNELPIHVHKVTPAIDDTFWVNLIGRGYPAPYRNFRWCTDRMKIKPTLAFIREQISRHGEVVIILGSRRSESASRAQVMSSRNDRRPYISRHKDIGNALVFTPIEDWSTEDVWEYLMTVRPPWGGDNSELVAMYRNAQAGECPLVIDKSTPSCGGGRFGCWCCTVIQKDRSMEAMIDNGQTWLEPILDFRDWLVSMQNPELKESIREHRRRTGRIEFFEPKNEIGKKGIVWGPYKFEVRKQILRRLLTVQTEVRRNGPDPNVSLIQSGELHKIRQMWLHDEGDWGDSLPAIYREATNEDLDWLVDDYSGLGGEEHEILTTLAYRHGVPPGILVELFDIEQQHQGMNKRAGIYGKIDAVLNKDWRSREEALSELSNLNVEHVCNSTE